ncbi:hypothetical protein ACFV3R_01815 [Streptomyces sp. NPDC059740]|uniref:hypothetical protein n=1 Tax=Streptomyces sp. NPDC059740 TaxID=3346926 RepID=UPI003663B6E3
MARVLAAGAVAVWAVGTAGAPAARAATGRGAVQQQWAAGTSARAGAAGARGLDAAGDAPGGGMVLGGSGSPASGSGNGSGARAYRPSPEAHKVTGGHSSKEAPTLAAGLSTDEVAPEETRYYAVRLDATSDVYVSAVAAPVPGTRVEGREDSLSVTLRDGQGRACGPQGLTRFQADGMTYPVADYTVRRAGEGGGPCRAAGVYYVAVERRAGVVSAAEPWPVELRVMTEPGLKGEAPKQPSPSASGTGEPAPPDGSARRVSGGTGFDDAAEVHSGVWRDHLAPGETRFYRVPVDWGQRLQARAEFGGSGAGTQPLVDGWGLSAYNPARGAVGRGRFVTVDAAGDSAGLWTAPVAYGNRENPDEAVGAMRMAGTYYLAVSLSPAAAKSWGDGVDLTLRVNVVGRPAAAPDYRAAPGAFSVADPDPGVAAGHGGTGSGGASSSSGGSAGAGGSTGSAGTATGSGVPPLRIAGWAGIGTGVTLLAVLAGWTVLARRRAPATSQSWG